MDEPRVGGLMGSHAPVAGGSAQPLCPSQTDPAPSLIPRALCSTMGFLTSVLVITPFLPPGGPLDPALHPISTCLDSTHFKAGQRGDPSLPQAPSCSVGVPLRLAAARSWCTHYENSLFIPPSGLRTESRSDSLPAALPVLCRSMD